MARTLQIPAYKSDGLTPDPIAIARAAEILRAGGLVAFPTETVYGLGAAALDPEAVARIFEAKGRPPNNPIIVHIADVASAKELASSWPIAADRLAAAFWPGPLTLVVARNAAVPNIVTAGGPTVALRVPSHPIARALLLASGTPIAAPSANRSTELSPTSAEHVYSSLGDRIDLILDGGHTPGGIESTVISVADDRLVLLRPGLISPDRIEAVIGHLDRVQDSRDSGPASEGSAPLPSPGMMERHYAPRAGLEQSPDGANRVRQLLAEGHTVGWVTRSADVEDSVAGEPGCTCTPMPENPEGYAAELYAALHSLDNFGVSRIVVDELPPTDEWLAIRDRLQRASR